MDALKVAAKAAKIAKDAYAAAAARMEKEDIFDDILLSELQEDEDRAMEAFYELCTPETILELLK